MHQQQLVIAKTISQGAKLLCTTTALEATAICDHVLTYLTYTAKRFVRFRMDSAKKKQAYIGMLSIASSATWKAPGPNVTGPCAIKG